MINKVQMFQIAGDKINKQLVARKMSPIFRLMINEAEVDPNYKRRLKSIESSKMEIWKSEFISLTMSDK